MYQFFVEKNQITDKKIQIYDQDVIHIKQVLRMKVGEQISVSNGKDGKEYICEIAHFYEDSIECNLCFIKEDEVELPVKIYLFQGLPKADKMELIVQKAVELGAVCVVPVATKRCVVKLDAKKAASKQARWQSIAEAAAKQSKRKIIPKVEQVLSFKEAVAMAKDMDVTFIPYEMAEGMGKTKELLEQVQSGQSVAIFIGPEGGFDETEIEAATNVGITPITLGKRILRTETAGFTILSWFVYLFEK